MQATLQSTMVPPAQIELFIASTIAATPILIYLLFVFYRIPPPQHELLQQDQSTEDFETFGEESGIILHETEDHERETGGGDSQGSEVPTMKTKVPDLLITPEHSTAGDTSFSGSTTHSQHITEVHITADGTAEKGKQTQDDVLQSRKIPPVSPVLPRNVLRPVNKIVHRMRRISSNSLSSISETETWPPSEEFLGSDQQSTENAVVSEDRSKNSRKSKDKQKDEEIQRNLALSVIKRQLSGQLSSGDCGDVSSCCTPPLSDKEEQKSKKKKKAEKRKKHATGSGVTSPRIPKIVAEKVGRNYAAEIGPAGGNVKLAHAMIHFPPGCLKTIIALHIAVFPKQIKRREDSEAVLLTPALHLWIKDTRRLDLLQFQPPVLVSLAQHPSSAAAYGSDVKIHKTKDLVNIDWKYFNNTKVSTGQFIRFAITQLGGYRAITSACDASSLICLNYILCVVRPDDLEDPSQHKFYVKFYTLEMQKSIHAELNMASNASELVFHEQVIHAQPASTLQITVAGEGSTAAHFEFRLPNFKNAIKRVFPFTLKKHDAAQFGIDKTMKFDCSISSPFIRTQSSSCDFQWAKKCDHRPIIFNTEINVQGRGTGVHISNNPSNVCGNPWQLQS